MVDINPCEPVTKYVAVHVTYKYQADYYESWGLGIEELGALIKRDWEDQINAFLDFSPNDYLRIDVIIDDEPL